jgi:hypothetical protein
MDNRMNLSWCFAALVLLAVVFMYGLWGTPSVSPPVFSA